MQNQMIDQMLKNPQLIKMAVITAGMLVLVKIVVAMLRSAKVKGRIGEGIVGSSLEKRLDPAVYTVVNDVMLPDGQGGTTQIDHVVLSRYGVFAIETKNYGGWIFGDVHDEYWLQSFRGGQKNRFQNPYRQNYKHLCVLSEVLRVPREAVKPLLIFIGNAEIKTREKLPPSLCQNSPEMLAYIHSFTEPILSKVAVSLALAQLSEKRLDNTRTASRSHVEYVRERRAKR